MYRWRKFASSQWVARNEAALQEQTNYGLAVIESPHRTQLLLEASSSSGRTIESLRGQFGGAMERLPNNWLRTFVQASQTKPLRIGNRLVIRSTTQDQRSKTHELVIPAAGAFGTGEHATTAMCLRLLEQFSRNRPDGWSMLDAGTGSGILALAARAFGAGRVIAIDSDPHAITIAKSNARLNRIGRVQFEIADATKYQPSRKFDVIVANLFSELLIKAIPNWKVRLKPAGILILSGILRWQERGVVRAIRRENLAVKVIRHRGKWIAVLAGERRLPACTVRQPAGRLT
jgi:ribosomal protein L11 methyltransferase